MWSPGRMRETVKEIVEVVFEVDDAIYEGGWALCPLPPLPAECILKMTLHSKRGDEIAEAYPSSVTHGLPAAFYQVVPS